MVASLAIPVAEEAEVLEDVGTVVAVVEAATTPDFLAGSLMRADHAVVVGVAADDGSATEWLPASSVMTPS